MLAWHTFIGMIHIDHIDPLHNIVVNNDFLKNGIPYPLYMASLPTFNHLLLPTNHTVPTLHLIYLLKMIKTINIIKSKWWNSSTLSTFHFDAPALTQLLRFPARWSSQAPPQKQPWKKSLFQYWPFFNHYISPLSHFYHQSNFNLKKSASKVEILN